MCTTEYASAGAFLVTKRDDIVGDLLLRVVEIELVVRT